MDRGWQERESRIISSNCAQARCPAKPFYLNWPHDDEEWTMSRYRGNIDAVRNLVQETEVHRDVYIDEEVFQLEMEHLFANTWVYVGHDSQVPNPGDYFGTTVGTQPILMVRHTDNTVRVLHNRCPHKGTRITTETCGNTGKFFRCPYHAWTFRTDGTLRQIPLSKGYDKAGLSGSHAAEGMNPVRHVHNYRGFVFAKLNDTGPSFEEFFGESLSSIDNMVDRSPAGRLEVAGGVLRYMHNCNWKMLVENQTDTCHPMVAHESSAGTAIDVWKRTAPGSNEKKPAAVEIYAPFMSSYEFFEKMGIRILPNGPRSYRRAPFDPFRLFGDPRLLREDGRGLRRRARQSDP